LACVNKNGTWRGDFVVFSAVECNSLSTAINVASLTVTAFARQTLTCFPT